MKLFGRSPARESAKKARELLASGEIQDCLRTLTEGFRKDVDHAPLYEIASEALNKAGGAEEAALFAAVKGKLGDPDVFRELGQHFLQVNHLNMAMPFLEKANTLRPKDGLIASLYADALGKSYQPRKALDALLLADRGSEFWLHYEVYYLSLLCNDHSDIVDFLRDSRRAFEQMQGVPEEVFFALDKLEHIRYRLLELGKPQKHIRDWHFVQYGGAILEYFEEENPAGGRYVAVFPQNDMFRRAAERLKVFLETTGQSPVEVLSLPDRGSEIVGRVMATVLGLPFRVAAPDQLEVENALIVAADNHAFNETDQLRKILPGQLTYAFNLDWLNQGRYSPDIAGIMSQLCQFPWAGGAISIDPETREQKRSEPDLRSAEEIAAEIIAADPDESNAMDKGLTHHMKFYKSHRKLLAFGSEGSGARLIFNIDSPVPGNHF